jgi:hypothetical protein
MDVPVAASDIQVDIKLHGAKWSVFLHTEVASLPRATGFPGAQARALPAELLFGRRQDAKKLCSQGAVRGGLHPEPPPICACPYRRQAGKQQRPARRFGNGEYLKLLVGLHPVDEGAVHLDGKWTTT